jgi:hypothetical protein
LIPDDLINVKWPDDEDLRDALSEMIVDCVRDLLSCKELEDHLLRQDDERLTTTIEVIHRHAESCRDMLKRLLNWASYYPEELRAAVEDFGLKCELAIHQLREHLPEHTPEAHAEGLSPLTQGFIRTALSAVHSSLASCDTLARDWFDITLY